MDRMDMNDRMDREMDKLIPQPIVLDDSARNQLRGLQHEACAAHCDSCDCCVGEGIRQVGVNEWEDVPYRTGDNGEVRCEDCIPDPDFETMTADSADRRIHPYRSQG